MAGSGIVINITGVDGTTEVIKSINKQLGALSSSSGWKAVMQGVGQGVGQEAFKLIEHGISSVAEAIPHLIEQGMAWGETVHHLQEATGASAEASSRLAGTFRFLGIDTENLGGKLRILAKEIIDQPEKMRAYGIATQDAHGVTLDMITVIDNARQALQGYGAGAERTAAAAKLFGRSGLEMLDFLSLSNEQVAALNTEMDALGVTMNEQGVVQAKALGREFNLFGLATQGVANQLLNDIGPALVTFVDSLASWVKDNARNIATFAAQVANFVLGMVNAITGANLTARSFTSTLALLGTAGATPTASAVKSAQSALDEFDATAKKGTGSTKGLTDALKKQTEAVDAQLKSLKDLDAEHDKEFAKQLGMVSQQVQNQLDQITAGEAAVALDERRTDLAKQLTAAQVALNDAMAGTADSSGAVTVDPRAVQSASDQIVAIQREQRDLEQGVANDARRAELGNITAFVDGVATAEKETTDKHKLLADEKAQADTLAAQIAAAQQIGDIKTVADLTIEQSALQLAMKRTNLALTEGDEVTAFEAKKARLAAETAAVSGAVADQGAIRRKGLADTLAEAIKNDEAAKKQAKETADYIKLQSSSMYGPEPTGSVGLMDAAMKKGAEFALSLKGAFETAAAGLKGLLDGLGWIVDHLADLGLAWAYIIDPKFRDAFTKKVDEATGTGGQAVTAQGAMSGIAGIPGAIGDAVNYILGGGKSGFVPGEARAAGGPVAAGGTYVVGERGPELLRMGGSGGAITPNGGGGTVNFGAGAIVVQGATDPQATAQAVMLAIKRELTRQGTSFASGY